MTALFVDHLTVIDFAYFDAHRGIVGESWIVDVVLHGELDEQGMVFDFGDVKKRIKQAIDASVDHKFVVPHNYEQLESSLNDDGLLLEIRDTQDRWYRHQSPQDSVVLLDSETVNFDAVAAVLKDACMAVVPDNVTSIDLTLREEHISGAYYHYAHGLKKHLGDCQRIAHGHRSQIHILENGQRNVELEQYWADKWRDIYIGTEEDLQKELEVEGVAYHHFSYTSQQGFFSLTLPSSRCHMMHNDSTVELIAAHIAKHVKAMKPNSAITIKAFEGVDKGAIASC